MQQEIQIILYYPDPSRLRFFLLCECGYKIAILFSSIALSMVFFSFLSRTIFIVASQSNIRKLGSIRKCLLVPFMFVIVILYQIFNIF